MVRVYWMRVKVAVTVVSAPSVSVSGLSVYSTSAAPLTPLPLPVDTVQWLNSCVALLSGAAVSVTDVPFA